MNTRNAVLISVRFVAGVCLVWAAVAKLAAPEAFFGALLGYRLPVGEAFLRLTAVTLPWLELICGAALLANVWAETVRPLVVLLFGLFVAILGQALLRGLAVDCGCFGGSAGSGFNQPVFAWGRALLLLAGAVALLVERRDSSK